MNSSVKNLLQYNAVSEIMCKHLARYWVFWKFSLFFFGKFVELEVFFSAFFEKTQAKKNSNSTNFLKNSRQISEKLNIRPSACTLFQTQCWLEKRFYAIIHAKLYNVKNSIKNKKLFFWKTSFLWKKYSFSQKNSNFFTKIPAFFWKLKLFSKITQSFLKKLKLF